jgi:signal transduction histidine kinase
MEMESERRQKRTWWLFALAIAASCLGLGVLQYNWIGEVSIAERDRMQASLRGSLQRLGRDFNGELSAAIAGLHPSGPSPDDVNRTGEYLKQYELWKETAPQQQQWFKRIALAVPNGDDAELLVLDKSALTFHPSAWPNEWVPVREQLIARLSGEGFRGGRRPFAPNESLVIEVPRFRLEPSPGPPGPDNGPPRRRMESEWLLLEINVDYLRTSVLPELLRRHLGGTDYDAAVTWSHDNSKLVFQNDSKFTGQPADATVRILEAQFDSLFRRGPPRSFGRNFEQRRDKGPGPAAPPDRGQWTLSVRHRAGSLEAVVQHGRWRNLAILSGLLLMMLGALGALIRFTQREQRLAKLQMDFVAGISHELRTPLSVIRTAAHNLHGGLVSHPKQIQRYGALIRDESERLTGIVEQVLRFAGAQAGRVIQAREMIRVESLLEEALAATSRTTDEAGCLVERDIAPALPFLSGDPVALRHAVINLVSNAAKYGFSGGWIGVRARLNEGAVEISVQDRGPGIEAKDQPHIFDPFYRGRKAIEDQTHGTGLGLNLVKRIAEAHDGTVTVKSEPGAGTEFTLRLPPAAVQTPEEDEFAHTIDRG